MQDKRTLVLLGGAGYIGSVIAEQAIHQGYKVKVIDRFFFGQDSLAHLFDDPSLIMLEKDTRPLEEQDLENCFAVIDLAGISNDPSADLNFELTDSINYHGSVHAAKIAKAAGVERYLYISSCSLYGFNEEICTETTQIRPLTIYAKSKAKAEQEILDLSDHSFSVTALRNATTFGLSSRMRFDLVVNIMTYMAMTKKEITVNGDGKQRRPLIHVADIADICLYLLNQPKESVENQILNIGINNYTVSEIANEVKRALNDQVSINYVSSNADHRDYEVSFDKFRSLFSFQPHRTIEYGVLEIAQALREGTITASPKTFTVKHYQKLLENYESSLLLT